MKKVVIAVVCSAILSGLAVLAWTALSQEAWPAAPGDSILTVPACAFNDFQEDYDFVRSYTLHLETGSGYFCAPVNLPQGSVIKKVILICKDNDSSNILLELARVSHSGSSELIVIVSSSGSDASYRIFSQKPTTSNNYVKNWKYSYLLFLYLPGTGSAGYHFNQAKIVYTPPSP